MRRTALHRLALAGTTLLTVAATGGCGTGGDGRTDPTSDAVRPVATSAAGDAGTPTFNDSDVSFAQLMIPHHRQAVEMSTLARTRAVDPELKTLAQRIEAAQEAEIRLMADWLVAWGAPTAMPGGQHDDGHRDSDDKDNPTAHSQNSMPGMMSEGDMATLRESSGDNFDRRFCTMMIAHHEGAIVMARAQLDSGASDAAKNLAREIMAGQQTEINTMRMILAQL